MSLYFEDSVKSSIAAKTTETILLPSTLGACYLEGFVCLFVLYVCQDTVAFCSSVALVNIILSK